MGHSSVLQTSCVPAPALLRHKAQSWSGNCNLFFSPLLLPASRHALPWDVPAPLPDPSPSCLTASPPSFPGEEEWNKAPHSPAWDVCTHVRLATAAMGDRQRGWWWDEWRKSQSFGAGNKEKIPVVGEHCEQHHEAQMAQLKREREEIVRTAREISFPQPLTLRSLYLKTHSQQPFPQSSSNCFWTPWGSDFESCFSVRSRAQVWCRCSESSNIQPVSCILRYRRYETFFE